MTNQVQSFREILAAERQAAGVSLAELARRTHYSKGYLGNLETGDRSIQLEHVEAYDQALGRHGLLVELFLVGSGDEVKRRAILEALGTISALGLSEPALVAESLRLSLLAALGGEDWPDITSEFGKKFMTDSPGDFRTQLTGQLLMLKASIDQPKAVGVRLAAPKLMTLHAMGAANIGNTTEAVRWYRAARSAADVTQDHSLQAWVRGRSAFRRGYEGATPDEVLLIGNGVNHVEAHLARAQAYARLGNGSTATAALVEAKRTHERSDHDPGTIYAMPGWRMAMSSAYVYALLGDVARCDAELSDEPPTNMRRWGAQLAMQRAVAFARSGDQVTGATLADQIWAELPKEQRSIVLYQMRQEATQ